MKITVDEQPKKNKLKFPCLMIANDGEIVLFHDNECGIVLKQKSSIISKNYSTSWMMQAFKPFTGKITLEND